MNSTPSLTNLEGKKGLIVGLANESSIAWGCAKLMRELGADIVGSCLNDKARRFVQPHTDTIGVDLQTCDVEQPGQLEALVDYATGKFGKLDFVIHSIAWAPLEDLHAELVDTSSTGFARAMDISCHSFARLARLCRPHMDGGSLISMSYLGAQRAMPNYGLMGPVKAALESLVRYLAKELGPQGIRVHAVSPGPILTRAASGIAHFDELMALAECNSPLGRLVTLEEISQLSAFLCSDASSGMTGQTIFVDAGYHAAA